MTCSMGKGRRPGDGARAHRMALITGATSGIGAAMARALPPATGLLLTGRNVEALALAARGLGTGGRRVETLTADLTDPGDRARLVEAAEAAEVDLFVNNAGAAVLARVLDQAPEDQARTIDLNVVAMAALTRALVPGMLARARQAGRRAGLIMVSSSTALSPLPYLATYTATKVFGLYYGEALAEELRGEPIDVQVLCPGPTRSEFGGRAGFSTGNVPGAADPDDVAKVSLAALGRRTIVATGRVNGPVVEALMAPRRLFTVGLGRVLAPIAKRSRSA